MTTWGPTLPTHDCYVYENAADAGIAHNTDVIAVRRNGAVARQRGLLQFDLSDIPAGSTISSATLQLKVTWYAFASNGPKNLEVRNLAATFDETTATWNNQPGQGAYASAAWAEPTALDEIDTVDIASIVEQYLGTNMPIIVKYLDAIETTSDALWTYGSSEHATAGYRPVLTVEYTAGGGATKLRQVGLPTERTYPIEVREYPLLP